MKLERLLQFFVEGSPRPAGSKNAFPLKRKDGTYVTDKNGRIIINMVDASGASGAAWRKVVGWTGKKAMLDACMDGLLDEALVVEFEFLMKRPGHHFGSKAGVPYLRKDAPTYHMIPPDVAKLVRAAEDSLTSVVWHDDCTTVSITASKRYANMNENTGCAITISRPITEGEHTLLPDVEELPLG